MAVLDRALRRIAQVLHMCAAAWLFGLAFLILCDVVGRGLFNRPLPGTTEIVANSIVTIAFLQLTHAVLMGGMLRAGILDSVLDENVQRWLRALAHFAGMAFFVALAFAAWEPMWRAIEILEYQGEGGLRVPTYPVRVVIVFTSALAAVAYALELAKAVLGERPKLATAQAVS